MHVEVLVVVFFSSGEKFTKKETFGQFPLQVNGFRDIHESLEATTMQDEIEAVNKDAAMHKSGQEVGGAVSCGYMWWAEQLGVGTCSGLGSRFSEKFIVFWAAKIWREESQCIEYID